MNQPTLTWLLVVLAIVVVGLVIVTLQRRRRTDVLRDRFGPEYDHLQRERGSKSRAEAELSSRSKRVDALPIRPLPADRRQLFADRWRQQQARFVDEPKSAIEEADHLVEEVMRERGYPITDFDQRAADISVDHPRVVQNYRAAHDIAVRGRSGQCTTEDFRQAMVYYRDLFFDLLDDPTPRGVPAR